MKFFIFSIFWMLSTVALGEPIVVVETNMGNLEVDLNSEKAPISVKNFLDYVDDRFYNDTIIHRVVNNFVAQGGGLTEKLFEKPTRGPIVNESKNGLSNLLGTVGMARDEAPDTATAQFYFNTKDNTRLDYQSEAKPGYAVFGKVIKGLEVLDAIQKVSVHTQGEYENVPDKVITLKIYRK